MGIVGSESILFLFQRLKVRWELAGGGRALKYTVLPDRGLIQILQPDGRTVFLKQPDAGALDRQHLARRLSNSLKRLVKIS